MELATNSRFMLCVTINDFSATLLQLAIRLRLVPKQAKYFGVLCGKGGGFSGADFSGAGLVAGWNTKVAPLQKLQRRYAERLENSLVLGLGSYE